MSLWRGVVGCRGGVEQWAQTAANKKGHCRHSADGWAIPATVTILHVLPQEAVRVLS